LSDALWLAALRGVGSAGLGSSAGRPSKGSPAEAAQRGQRRGQGAMRPLSTKHNNNNSNNNSNIFNPELPSTRPASDEELRGCALLTRAHDALAFFRATCGEATLARSASRAPPRTSQNAAYAHSASNSTRTTPSKWTRTPRPTGMTTVTANSNGGSPAETSSSHETALLMHCSWAALSHAP
jgi:hypothetical protein